MAYKDQVQAEVEYAGGLKWKFVPADFLQRDFSVVFVSNGIELALKPKKGNMKI